MSIETGTSIGTMVTSWRNEFDLLINNFDQIAQTCRKEHPDAIKSFHRQVGLSKTALSLAPETGIKAFIDKTHDIWVVDGKIDRDALVRRCLGLVMDSDEIIGAILSPDHAQALDDCWENISQIVRICLEFVEAKRKPVWKDKNGKMTKVYQETYIKSLSYSKTKAVWQ